MSWAKSVLNMMMMSFGAFGVVGLIYVIYGYSISSAAKTSVASSPTLREALGLLGPTGSSTRSVTRGYGNIPELIFVGFQLTFAVITVALISGAIADRVKFSTWLVFSGPWSPWPTSRSRTWCGWWSAVRQ